MSEIIQHCTRVLGNSITFLLRSSLNLIYVFSPCSSLLFFKNMLTGTHNILDCTKNAWKIQFSKGVKYNKVSKK